MVSAAERGFLGPAAFAFILSKKLLSGHRAAIAIILSAVITPPSYGRTTEISGAVNVPTPIVLGETPSDVLISESTQRLVGTGDFNGDAADDVLLETLVPTVPIPEIAEADIIFGKKGATSPAGIMLSGSSPDVVVELARGGALGRILNISSIGDINRDLIADITMTATAAMGPGGKSGTAIFIFAGSKNLKPGALNLSEIPPFLTVFEESAPIPQPVVAETPDSAGVVVLTPLCIADINGDGANDLIFVENKAGLATGVSVLLGPFSQGQVIDLGSKRPDITITTSSPEQLSVSSIVADVNGDGIEDLLIGRPDASRHGPGSGEVDIILGSRSLKTGLQLSLDRPDAVILGATGGSRTPGVITPGDTPGDQIGRIMSAGDFNGDGTDDVLLAAPYHGRSDASLALFSGECYVIFGSSSIAGRTIDLALGQQDLTITGASPGDSLGAFVSSGDINGDIVDDIVVGAPGARTSAGSQQLNGAAYVILGSENFKTGTIIDVGKGQQDVTVINQGPPGVQILSVSANADFNGDQINDLLVQRSGEAILGGAVYIYFGSDTQPPVVQSVKLKRAPFKLLVFGSHIDASVQVEINGAPINGTLQFIPGMVEGAGELIVRGSRHELNLHSGSNTLVIVQHGARSAGFLFLL